MSEAEAMAEGMQDELRDGLVSGDGDEAGRVNADADDQCPGDQAVS